jgi:signal transduction histidine kinase
MLKKDFFTSGWSFSEDERYLRNKFQMMNIAILLSSTAVVYGSILNIYKGFYYLAIFEFSLFLMNIFLWFLLRRSKSFYDLVSIIVTAQFTFLLLLLVYVSSAEDMKHTWYFTYPIIILYFKNEKYAIPWFIFLISMLLIAPIQPFFHTDYTFFQLFYLSFVLSVVSIIVYFYKVKMDEATHIISTQEKVLSKKVEELTQKDKMLTLQSKQAVMGEMISMIAHQWRQPLSTVTLSISNLQVKKLLGEEINPAEVDKALENISDTVVYLSQTIDDFQTYFRPDKELNNIDINELIQKAIAFVEPRLKKTDIEIQFFSQQPIEVMTYTNELIQVLLNIINNAVDELISRDIKHPQVIINIFNREEAVAISIADNAGGIDEEHLDSIFEPYFSTKGKNGTGLGLYMSQMIMQKQFHTEIEVKSTNYGSIFTIIVPKKLA